MNVLFVGDIFGHDAMLKFANHLPGLCHEFQIDFVIVQGENISDRKGLTKIDYDFLTIAGVHAFTMGNHIWSKEEIFHFIDNSNIIRPYNINNNYRGQGSKVFQVKDKTLRVTSMLGIDFNELRTNWTETKANNFFDAFDELNTKVTEDFHIIDFHAETTSEKAVFGLYVDGKVSAFVGTHTHVQTSDERTLPQGTLFITDVGMTGPINAAIGANYEEVYLKMRFNKKVKFKTSNNSIELNAVVLSLHDKNSTIQKVKRLIK